GEPLDDKRHHIGKPFAAARAPARSVGVRNFRRDAEEKERRLGAELEESIEAAFDGGEPAVHLAKACKDRGMLGAAIGAHEVLDNGVLDNVGDAAALYG